MAIGGLLSQLFMKKVMYWARAPRSCRMNFHADDGQNVLLTDDGQNVSLNQTTHRAKNIRVGKAKTLPRGWSKHSLIVEDLVPVVFTDFFFFFEVWTQEFKAKQ